MLVVWLGRFDTRETGNDAAVVSNSARAALPETRAEAELPTAEVNGRALQVDAWLTADAEPLLLKFWDQSRVELRREAKARLTALDAAGVALTLESGELEATVTPGTPKRWVFNAGPYRVTVLGTVFSITWQPTEERLVVAVTRGKVKVTGGKLEAEERTVAAGESLSIAPLEELAPSPKSGAVPSGVSDSSSQTATSRGARSVSEPRAPNGAATEWKALAERGEFQAALRTAEAAGFDALTRSLNAADLLLLADAARLGGSAARAD